MRAGLPTEPRTLQQVHATLRQPDIASRCGLVGAQEATRVSWP